jgi:photosystem II stability/assembly factor-like uncharacterized protein
MIHKLPAYVVVLCVFIFSSCKKIIVETIPVIEYTDISIPNARGIQYFSFPDNQVGYAASDTNFIYKTTDGGKTWAVIKNADWPYYQTCKGIVFYDALNGFCLMGAIAYSTTDGGVNWVIANPWYGVNSTGAFCGITSSGVGIMGRAERYGYVTLYATSDKGKTFYDIGTTIRLRAAYRKGKVSGDFISILTNLDNTVYGLSYSTLKSFEWMVSGMGDLSDFFYTGTTEGFAVGPKGKLTACYSTYQNYNGPIHSYDYFSIDGQNDLILAVTSVLILLKDTQLII